MVCFIPSPEHHTWYYNLNKVLRDAFVNPFYLCIDT